MNLASFFKYEKLDSIMETRIIRLIKHMEYSNFSSNAKNM